MNVIKEIRIKIVTDDDPMNPREYDNLGEILYTSSRYTLGDRQASSDEIQEIIDNKNNITLPVYAYIHSGTALNTTGFSCIFDSGQCGIIWVSKDKVRKEWKKVISKKLMETVIKGLICEVDTYSKYLGGESYGYVIEDAEGDHIDSCYGFWSVEDAEMSAKEAV